MKKFVVPALLLGLVCAGSLYAITKDQATVIPVLETLQLAPIKSKVIGGPQKFKVTQKTIDLLQKTMDDGHVIILGNDGSIKIEKE